MRSHAHKSNDTTESFVLFLSRVSAGSKPEAWKVAGNGINLVILLVRSLRRGFWVYGARVLSPWGGRIFHHLVAQKAILQMRWGQRAIAPAGEGSVVASHTCLRLCCRDMHKCCLYVKHLEGQVGKHNITALNWPLRTLYFYIHTLQNKGKIRRTMSLPSGISSFLLLKVALALKSSFKVDVLQLKHNLCRAAHVDMSSGCSRRLLFMLTLTSIL